MSKVEIETRRKLARRIKNLREARDWTQTDLADRTDLTMRHIQRLESTKRPPSAEIDTLAKLARAFGKSLYNFLRI